MSPNRAGSAGLHYAGETINIDGLKVIVDRRIISEDMVGLLKRGDYDAPDRYLLRKYLKPGDLLLECGGGVGVTSMTARAIVGASGAVVTIEPDPDICRLLRANAALNECSLEIYHGAAIAERGAETVDFYRSKNFSSSSTVDFGAAFVECLSVPGRYPPDLITAHDAKRKVMLCDVEGYETSLLCENDITSLFDVVLAEIHNFGRPQKANSVGVGRLFRKMHECGFEVLESVSHSWVWAKR